MEDNKSENKIVQTYAEDMAEAIGSEAGLVKKIIHGEEEHDLEKKSQSPESKTNKIFMIFSILLMALALGTLYFFFLKTDINEVPVEKQFTPLFFLDQSTFLEVGGMKKDEMAEEVWKQANRTSVKVGGVEGIYLTDNNEIIGLRKFLSLIKATFVPGEDTLLIKDNFLMGIENSAADASATNREGFFMLLKVRSTMDIFDALRAWEKKMLTDLHGFFGVSISSDTDYLFTKNFEDGIIENKNARILFDKDGGIILMYIFADENSVLITNSEPAAHEIVLRLAGSQKAQ